MFESQPSHGMWVVPLGVRYNFAIAIWRSAARMESYCRKIAKISENEPFLEVFGDLPKIYV